MSGLMPRLSLRNARPSRRSGPGFSSAAAGCSPGVTARPAVARSALCRHGPG